MSEVKFFKCMHCGNIAGLIHNSGVPMVCCGDKMTELIPNTTDAAQEKHVPVVNIEGSSVTVTVGSTLHPMEEKHYIQWVYIQTSLGGQRHTFKPGDKGNHFCPGQRRNICSSLRILQSPWFMEKDVIFNPK